MGLLLHQWCMAWPKCDPCLIHNNKIFVQNMKTTKKKNNKRIEEKNHTIERKMQISKVD